MLPLNNELGVMAMKGEKDLVEKNVDGKLRRWEMLNRIRMGLGGVGFGLGVVGASVGWTR
jgi:hypothetical protein